MADSKETTREISREPQLRRSKKAVQDYYGDDHAICYGCGRDNSDGLHIRTHWDGTTGTAFFTPDAAHTAYAGRVYGGILASLIDCHSVGTAIAAMHDHIGEPLTGRRIALPMVTGTMTVKYLAPTPIDATLKLVSRVESITDRKAVVQTSLFAGDIETVRGEVIAIRPRFDISGGQADTPS